MAAVTLLGTATFNTTSGTKTVTATPAVGDLIVIVTAHSGNTSTAAPTDNNSSGTYTLVNTAVKATSADTMKVWVRNALITSATSTVFTHAPGTSTGGGLAVLKITGMSLTGSSAIVRSAIQSNIASGTPAPVLAATPGINNAIITAVFNATSPAGVTQRTGYTRSVNLGYATPTTGLAVAHDDAGETSATITWGSSSATAFCSIAVEINAAVTHGTTGALTGPGSGIIGAAAHSSLHSTAGDLPGQTAVISGSAVYNAKHTTAGALIGSGSTVDGAATRFRAHATDGVLPGQTAVVTGDADREASIIPHVATGDIVGAGSTLSGSASRFRAFVTSGALAGTGSTITGDADREGQIIPHPTAGAITGPGSTLSGSASRFRAFETTGSLNGAGAQITGDADRAHEFDATGDLIGAGAVLQGAAEHVSAYPDPSDVRAGVQYGPGGIYVGTLTVGGGETIIRLRSFTERF